MIMSKELRLASVALFVLLLSACAGEKTATPPPKAPAGAIAVPPGPPGVTATGEQYAMSDAPSSRGPASDRPQMNASAAQAHRAGLAAFQKGDLRGAKTQFQKAVEADAKAFQAWYSLGVVLERLGDTAGALRAYQRAAGVVSDYEPAIVAYGVLLARTGKPDEAESYLNARQAKMPNSAAVLTALAEVNSIQGDSGEAQRLAQQALKKNPDYRPAMLALARDHYRARRLDLALYTLKGILDGYGDENPPRDKRNAEARLIRGLIYKEQRHRAAAIDEFKKAIELRPDLVEARIHLATYLLEAGNPLESARLLEAALRYDDDHVLARLNLGDAYRLLGKTEQAKRELEWVLKKEPNLAQAHYNLGLLYLFSENVPGVAPTKAADLAIEHLQKYKEMRPRATTGPDDTEELITRAKTKKALIEAQPAKPSPSQAAKPSPSQAAQPTQPAQPAQPGGANSGALPPLSGGGK
jgi:Tfp pilus assembly protein PilF